MLRPPLVGLASVQLGHSATPHSHASLQHSLRLLVVASQALLPAQTVSYRRNGQPYLNNLTNSSGNIFTAPKPVL
jgi:hypothetical protein